ncbi:nucleotidyltransferase family protein [Sphingomonas suaedae]|uniref:Nucleotidyltransferase family protein n=1 Tax=Sphingomonas suaedae TaxID=2599297 RepID=A0A518RFM7_9SPHN|nr:nucleotidyltransferase family protein [Sphingomonas suaedae]QDX26241.1 nucleotidyltransferase family protein [Sphingomonas suaedae]
MIAAERTALILLAAGRSRRFGAADKLTIPYLGRPLGLHVVVALEAVPFCARIAVVADTALDLTGCGYTIVTNDDPAAGLGRSLRLGVEAAQASDPDAVLIALADMPRVTATHIYRLLDHAQGDDAIVASSDGVIPRPPALFGRAHIPALLAARGDMGARDLVRRGHHVVAPPSELIDIDTPQDLEKLAKALRRNG